MKNIKIGWAQTGITPSYSALMEGQMYMRYSAYVHDEITATALALDNGACKAIFVSCDMTEYPAHSTELIKAEISARGIDFDYVTINVTHTHTSTSFYADFMREENKQVYNPDILPDFPEPRDLFCGDRSEKFFVEKIADLVETAWNRRDYGGISYAHDYAAIAFNRRPRFGTADNAESIMYGDCSRSDFRGFESGIDTSVELLYTWDEGHTLTGVICNVPCPSQVYELHSFLSADYWGAARNAIREKLGENLYILPMCGAAGDLAPVDLVQISKHNKQALLDWGGQTKEVFRNFDMTLLCQDIGDRISECVVRGYKKARNYIQDAPVFEHLIIDMALPIRKVSEEDYAEAVKQVEEIHKAFSKEHPMTMADLVKAFEPQGVILRHRQQLETPNYSFSCHIIRLGEVAIATNPFELFHEYGQIIKARAKAEQVFIAQLSNGIGGYLPTRAAVEGGSYSSKPASTTCGPDGGEVLVEKTLDAINGLW